MTLLVEENEKTAKARPTRARAMEPRVDDHQNYLKKIGVKSGRGKQKEERKSRTCVTKP